MTPAILVINAGSSNIKFAVYPTALNKETQPLLRGLIEENADRYHLTLKNNSEIVSEKYLAKSEKKSLHELLFTFIFDHLQQNGDYKIIAAGHRVVHGGEYKHAIRIDEKVLKNIEDLTPLAPLHQPENLAAIRMLQKIAPELNQVACFDTAFHHTQPLVAQQFGLPKKFFDDGIKRYGFHGLSYEYIAQVLPSTKHKNDRTIIAHLGSGASMCALKEGKSIATTMGLTALDGLPMGTRCGTLDPGVILYLQDKYGMTLKDITDLLYQRSGLLGLAGDSDMRRLLSRTDPDAVNAVTFFVYRIIRELGSLVAALGGLDTLVFTGGIGERASIIREKICCDAAWLGSELDDEANKNDATKISATKSKVSVYVIPTNEEYMIAQHVAALLKN